MKLDDFIKKLKEYPPDWEEIQKSYERKTPSFWGLIALIIGIVALAIQIDKVL